MGKASQRAVLVTCLFLLSVVTQAEGRCPELPLITINPTQSEWISVRDELGASVGLCLNSPTFFALYGAALMNTSSVSQAIEMLERALLLSPDNGGALIDYASALYLSGELLAALEINRGLLERSDVPLHLRGMLRQRQSMWESERVRWQGRFAILGGYHDNLNGVADLESLTLTLAGEELLVLLGDNSKPVEGGYVSSRLSLQRVHRLDEGLSRFSVTLQDRTTDLARVDTDEINIGYGREYEHENGGSSWGLESSYLVYGNNGLYASLAGQMSRYWDSENCSPFVEARGRSLYFSEQQHLDELATALGGGVRCGFSGGQLTLGSMLRYNQALDTRPGGDRVGAELNLKWQMLLGEGIFFSQLSLVTTSDRQGYSALLENNDERVTDSASFSMQYIYPITPDLSLHAGYYYRNQNSNIELFDTHSTNVDVGLSVSF